MNNHARRSRWVSWLQSDPDRPHSSSALPPAMRALSAIVFGAIGFVIGVLLQAPVGGLTFTDWRGPVASLTMAGFGAGTGMGLGIRDGDPVRRGIAGSVVGATTGLILGIAGSGIVVTSIVAVVLAVSLMWEGRQP